LIGNDSFLTMADKVGLCNPTIRFVDAPD
jgi:hypothetical protein